MKKITIALAFLAVAGFAAAQDADSGGREGAYYFFTEDEVKDVIGTEGKHFCECYDITPEGNFNGDNIPNLLLNNRWSLLPEGYDEFREKLRIFREGRMELAVDDKVLTAWNGLVLMALSRAAWVFGDKRYLAEAKELEGFMEKRLYAGGRLMSGLCKDKLSDEARLDDYAFYALGLLELYRADFDVRHIERATELADEIFAHFADSEGGYFMTSDTAEELIFRPKENFDGAMPCGNSACAVLFDLLGRYTGEEKYRSAQKSLLEVSNESARGQSDAIVTAARSQAQKTVAEAQEQANAIVAEAQKKAETILRERIGRMSAVCAQLNDMFDKGE